MLKNCAVLLIAATGLLTTQAALANAPLAHSSLASSGACFSVLSQGTDGADRFDAKMAQHQAQRRGQTLAACVPGAIFITMDSQGTDGVDHFDAKMRHLSATNQHSASAKAATVSLNLASNGTDGVDRFDSRMRQLAGQ